MTELLTPPNGVAPVASPVMAAQPPPAARDFTRNAKVLDFTIDSDRFEAAARLPAEIFVEFVGLYNDRVSESFQQQVGMLRRALELALLPESWERFSARLKDRAHPIDDEQISEIVLWLLEEYGMRPTQPSQPSSDGPASPESGTSSTESTPPAESISLPSQPTDS